MLKDEEGNYEIPSQRQRPIFLIGAPGIGKTQIMEQISKECEIGLVAYTITHHTRQSAIGLPFISKHIYGGNEYSVTEYTMSEIVASVYNKIEESGLKEGILFIDEINCVSETLAPAMLQFLQYKTFGNHAIPEGWIIVAAGNPPEYNKSVREFDVVTMDRVKKIEVEPDFSVWKEYAYVQDIHPAVISYLTTRVAYFYQMETTVDGMLFATPRGWEDLSRLIQVYEKLEITVDREVVVQYIQYPKIAKDFANYLELYRKYQKEYGLERILAGCYEKDILERLKFASFDERLSVVNLLVGKMADLFKEEYEMEKFVEGLFAQLCAYKEELQKEGAVPGEVLAAKIQSLRREVEQKKAAGQLTKAEMHHMERILCKLEEYQKAPEFESVKATFDSEEEQREQMADKTLETLNHCFEFLESAFGESQEMAVFVTELNSNVYSIAFLRENDCAMYYKYNKGLLLDERREEILEQMDAVENVVERGLVED
ncbi:MAG: ATP-binding protein [Dorea sp.]